MLAVIDYGAGNLYSVCNTLDYLNIPHTVTADDEAGRLLQGLSVRCDGVGDI